jgi:type II secretory pathway component PulK
MSSIEELLLIRGVTPELYFGHPELEQLPLPELLTVYGHRSGRINVNTAEPELLAAVGEAFGIPGLAEMVVEQRQVSPFVSTQDLTARGIMPPVDPGAGRQARRSRPFTVASNAFRLQGHGLAGDSIVRIEAYVWRDTRSGPDGFRIMEWREIR